MMETVFLCQILPKDPFWESCGFSDDETMSGHGTKGVLQLNTPPSSVKYRVFSVFYSPEIDENGK